MRVSIVIPTCNHCDDLLRPCLTSVLQYTDLSNSEVIVVANGCKDNTRQYVEGLDSPIRLILLEEVAGYTKAVNAGIKAATGEYVVLLNNDVQLLDQQKNDWIDKLSQPFERDNTVGITGCAKSRCWEIDREFMIFFCVMLRKRTFDELGLLDEIFNPGFGEDIDYCCRIESAGLRMVQVPEDETTIFIDGMGVTSFPLYHKAEGTVHDQRTIKNFGITWAQIIKRNIGILKDRYAIDYIAKIKEQDTQLYDTIILKNEYAVHKEDIHNKIVVDVGANIGFFSALCLSHSPKHIYAIEPVPVTFDKLRDFYKDEKRVTSLQNAVLDTHGKTVCLSDTTTGSRVVSMLTENKAVSITLKQITDRIEGNDLVLKLDCEGSEFPIMLGTPKEVIRRFKTIFVEIHEFGCPPPERYIQQGVKFPAIQYLIDTICGHGYEFIHSMGYFGWKVFSDGTESEHVDLPIKVCKFIRKSEPKYSIIIPTFNKCDLLLKPCIESIKQYTNLSEVEVLVIANGCTDNTRSYVESLGYPFKIIWHDAQLGYTEATNDGIKHAEGEYIVLLNNDVILLPQEKSQWLKQMELPFSDSKVGITGPMKFNGIKGKSNDFMMFCCCMIPRKVIDVVGILDENFSPGGVEDVDFGLRLNMAGYEIKQVPDEFRTDDVHLSVSTFPMYHPGGSTVRDNPNWDQTLHRNNEYLKKKFPDHFKGIDWIEERRTPRVFDCFPFFNELELLEVRLAELYDIVDYFVITEGDLTHSGKSKPLYLMECLKRFDKYKDKIILCAAKLNPINKNPLEDAWIRERQQRDAAMEVLSKMATDNDYVIISDADEIPNSVAVKQYINDGKDAIGVLRQERYNYYLNYHLVSTNEPQLNSKIVKFNLLKRLSLCAIRYCDRYDDLKLPYYYIENGGWHFTFMGGVEKVKQKIQSFAHIEYDYPEKMNSVESCIAAGQDIYSAQSQWEIVEIDSHYPKLIQKERLEFAKKGWVKPKPKIYDCFMFFNELDVLETRFNELYNVVDRFVIIEARQTHSGKDKPLNFHNNLHRFAKFLNKVSYHVVEEFPSEADSWTASWMREDYQRTYIMRCLLDVGDDDMVIISDCDEIPNADKVKWYPHCMAFKQRLYYYDSRTISKDTWQKAKIVPFRELKARYEANPQWAMRDLRNEEDCGIIEDGGRHLAWFGGLDAIMQKLDAFSHQELKVSKEEMVKRIESRKDLFGIDLVSPPTGKDVTAYVSSKNRYWSTLPSAILSIISQSVKPGRLVIFLDGEHIDLRDDAVYSPIFRMLDLSGIAWEVVFGEGKGQVLNHQKAIEITKTPYLFRIDDDDYLEPNVLEELLSCMTQEVGAVAGVVIDPNAGMPQLPDNYDTTIHNLDTHCQWYVHAEPSPIQVEHLYNSFLFRKEAAEHGYCPNLSPAGFREETLFSYEMHRAGWKLIVNPKAMIWHLKQPQNGIRTYNNHPEYWIYDEQVFQSKLKEWCIKTKSKKIIILDNGKGDHVIFKMILPEVKARFADHDIIIAVCYPDIFQDESDIRLISIAEVHEICSRNGIDPESFNIYKFAAENNWQGSFLDAFRKLYLEVLT